NYSGLVVEITKTHQRIDLLQSPVPANSPRPLSCNRRQKNFPSAQFFSEFSRESLVWQPVFSSAFFLAGLWPLHFMSLRSRVSPGILPLPSRCLLPRSLRRVRSFSRFSGAA